MKIVSTSYINTHSYNDPEKWLERINFYTGILEELAKYYQVESIEQINYNGEVLRKNVTYHFLNFKKRKLYFPRKLHSYIKNLNPDIVFVNGFIFPIQIIQLRKKLGEKVKFIVLHRAEKPFPGIKGYLQKIADRSIDAYLFASGELGEEWIRKKIIRGKEKIYEVMQASSIFHKGNKTSAREAVGIDGNPVFLWVGRLDANKDPVTVIKAFVNYISFQPTAKLYMIYQSDELLPEIKKLLIEKQAEEAIRLIGKVEYRQLQDWYNAADYFISGSHYEGSGIAACEAMSCGCIPILTDIISFRKMIGPDGLLYEPGNVEQLTVLLLRTKELNRELISEKTVDHFKEELSFEAIANKIKKVINSLN